MSTPSQMAEDTSDDVRVNPLIPPDLVCPNCITTPGPKILCLERQDTAKLLSLLEANAAVDFQQVHTLFDDVLMLEFASSKLKHITQESFSFRTFDDIIDTFKEHKLEALGYVLLHGVRVTFNIVARIVHGVTGMIADYTVAAPLLLKLWKTKIRYLTKFISREKLNQIQVEAYPYQVFVSLCPLLKTMLNFCYDVERVCLVDDSKAVTPAMRQMTSLLEKHAIYLDKHTQKWDTSHYALQRDTASLATLGYDPDYFQKAITYTELISHYFIRGGKPSPLFEEQFTKVATTLATRYGVLEQEVQSGKLTKESTGYRDRVAVLAAQTTRLQYCSQLLSVAVTLSGTIIKDAVRIFRKVEQEATTWTSDAD